MVRYLDAAAAATNTEAARLAAVPLEDVAPRCAAQVDGQEKIREAQKAGHGILITPNHPHAADPLSLFHLSQATGSLFYVMASWHLFMEGAIQRFLIRTMGAFSIYREGIDRSSLQFAMEVLEKWGPAPGDLSGRSSHPDQ
mgnify:CR=1 FL=1